MKKIAFYEPWFFLLFGVFHLHRIWGMIDRKSYADFWIGIWESRNAFYYVLMIILAMVCLLGIISFLRISITTIGGNGYMLQVGVIFYLTSLPYLQDVKSDKRSDLH